MVLVIDSALFHPPPAPPPSQVWITDKVKLGTEMETRFKCHSELWFHIFIFVTRKLECFCQLNLLSNSCGSKSRFCDTSTYPARPTGMKGRCHNLQCTRSCTIVRPGRAWCWKSKLRDAKEARSLWGGSCPLTTSCTPPLSLGEGEAGKRKEIMCYSCALSYDIQVCASHSLEAKAWRAHTHPTNICHVIYASQANPDISSKAPALTLSTHPTLGSPGWYTGQDTALRSL